MTKYPSFFQLLNVKIKNVFDIIGVNGFIFLLVITVCVIRFIQQ